jgi:hypothetical protein
VRKSAIGFILFMETLNSLASKMRCKANGV